MAELTIITVTYQDPMGLRRTLNSLAKLAPEVPFEHVVVDGDAAATRAAGIDYGNRPWPVRVLAEPPRGIYQAMNSGLRHATGKVTWFLNGGDEAGDPSAVRDALKALVAADVACGAVRILRDGKPRSVQMPPPAFWKGLRGKNGFCHQAVFARTSALKSAGMFGDGFRFAADYELLFKLWRSGAKYARVPGVVAAFHRGGASDGKFREVMAEFREIQKAGLRDAGPKARFTNAVAFRFEQLRLGLVTLARVGQKRR